MSDHNQPEIELSKQPEVHLRSSEVQEILGKPPSWLVRWGTILVLLACVVLGVVSYIVNYPDIIDASATISTQSPPVAVVAQISAPIEELNVEEGDRVVKGKVLATLESAANPEDVIRLREILAKYTQGTIRIPNGLKLGSLQTEVSNLAVIQRNLKMNKDRTFEINDIEMLRKQITGIENLNKVKKSEIESLEKEKELAETTYLKYKKLLAEGAVSAEAHQVKESEFLAKDRAIKARNSDVIQNELNISSIQRRINEIQQGKATTETTGQIELDEYVNRIIGKVDEWNRDHVILAPIDGLVTFPQFLAAKQYVNKDDRLLTIVPESENIVARLVMPLKGSGKVHQGQEVQIKLDAYPYEEFGVVKGTVNQISKVPANNKYSVEVALNDGLKTTYGQELEFQQEMSGSAEIITDRKRLVERLFDQIISIVKNR